MHISERSVYRFAERYKATGDVRLFAKRNGPRQLLCESEELLLIQQILLHSGIYLRELQDNLFKSTGQMVDASTTCRTMHCLGFTRQKIKHVSSRQSEERRAEFQREISALMVHQCSCGSMRVGLITETRFENMDMVSEASLPVIQC